MEDPQTVPSTPLPPPPVAAEGGLSDNAAGALAYITILPAILFLILEPYSKRPFVRFHAFQCIGLAVCAFALGVVMIIPILGWIVGIVGDLVLFVCWIMCIVKASKGERWKVPVIGNYVENMAK
ncbi:MAG TPA: DUF4870 domain-containing protein [Acidobacteriaceae bacterium]|jgi:uncharacterized membrane protein|nr:DUF4870 domain-containing protein [Acidobacteriaceae bacterium]